MLGGKVNPEPVPLIGKVPPTGTGAEVVGAECFEFLVSSFRFDAWFDLLTPDL